MVTSGQLCIYPDLELFLAAFRIFTVEPKECQTFADLLLSEIQVFPYWMFALHTIETLSGGDGGAIGVAEPM